MRADADASLTRCSRRAREGAPAVSVVVSTYNRAGRLDRLLEGLHRQTLEPDRFEVVIVDNGSSDGTAAVLEAALAANELALTVIEHERNLSPALARERGWRAARAGLVAFTDDDCVPHAGWLEAGLASAESRPGAILQGRTEPDPAEAERVGPFSRSLTVRGPDPGFQTCNIFYPRELLERIDGFDHEAFPQLGGEDTDLAWRAIEAGATTGFVTEALVHHAVADLGPVGRLRSAVRWAPAMLAYRRHRGLRSADLVWGLFWKRSHRDLFLLLLALALPLPRPVRVALVWPCTVALWRRSRALGGPWWTPAYLLALDAAEAVAVVRGGIAYGRPLF